MENTDEVMKKIWLLIPLLLLAIAGCAQADQDDTTTDVPSQQPAENIGGGSDNTVQVIPVEAYQYGWEPSPIRVDAGRPVRLKLSSRDVAHGFGVAELGISKRIPAGETTTVEFTPNQTGTYDVRCTVYCGQGHSAMNTQLIVE